MPLANRRIEYAEREAGRIPMQQVRSRLGSQAETRARAWEAHDVPQVPFSILGPAAFPATQTLP